MIRTLAAFLFLAFYTTLNSQMDSLSYSIGVVIAKNLEGQGISTIDYASFMDGMKNAMEGQGLKVDVNTANNNFQRALEAAKLKQEEVVKLAGEAFLKANAGKPGVMTTASGLQYEVIQEGQGAMPTISDKVRVHYHGTLTDGTVFDSSIERNEPISFPLGNVIKGWQEGLQLMKVGSKHRLFIPHDLAYGSRSAGPVIKPYSALVFDVELLAIE